MVFVVTFWRALVETHARFVSTSLFLLKLAKVLAGGSDREAAGQAGLKLARVLDLYLNSRTYNTYNSGR